MQQDQAPVSYEAGAFVFLIHIISPYFHDGLFTMYFYTAWNARNYLYVMKGTYMATISKFSTVLQRFKSHPLVEKMERSKLFAKFGRKTWWIILAVLVTLIGGGITYYRINATSAQTASTETLQTSVARRGDLTIYASGSGSLTALDQVDLGFATSGQVSQIDVSVGDVVKSGDLLAVIDDNNAQVQYTQAKRNLLELTSPSAIALPKSNS